MIKIIFPVGTIIFAHWPLLFFVTVEICFESLERERERERERALIKKRLRYDSTLLKEGSQIVAFGGELSLNYPLGFIFFNISSS